MDEESGHTDRFIPECHKDWELEVQATIIDCNIVEHQQVVDTGWLTAAAAPCWPLLEFPI
ncbi:hypothetical protein E2C01_005782 [Portunus trituberculatus]|uniref:Uncharacterized protein n=1 Tax=Portunus trituberculatus TaxID=210409 RepID=A0A5B7D024_PORTR|nr:hypothetical protein [Portunus trituberculatus]